jgi:hypothetical protein
VDHLGGRAAELEDGVAEAPRRRGDVLGGLLPWCLGAGVPLRLWPAGLGQREPPTAVDVLTGDQALLLQQLQGGVDRAGTPPVRVSSSWIIS